MLVFAASSQSLIQRLVAFKIFELSVLKYVGSVAEPDKAISAVENIALQRVSAGLCSLVAAVKVLAAKKFMLMVSSSGARLLVLVLPPDLMQCQQAWPVFELPRIMMAEPFILAPGVGTTCIYTPLLPTLPPPLSDSQHHR